MVNERAKLGIMALCCFSCFALIMFVVINGVYTYNSPLPCVDGDGDANLEGIMCDKTINTFYGMELDNDQSFLLAIFALIATVCFFLGLISLTLFFYLGTQSSGGANNG